MGFYVSNPKRDPDRTGQDRTGQEGREGRLLTTCLVLVRLPSAYTTSVIYLGHTAGVQIIPGPQGGHLGLSPDMKRLEGDNVGGLSLSCGKHGLKNGGQGWCVCERLVSVIVDTLSPP